jgi:hypothetical protein
MMEAIRSLDTSLHTRDTRRHIPEDDILQIWIVLLVIADIASSSLILFTLMMEAILSSETLVPTIAARRHILEDDILHSHRRENLKSYIALTGWTL